MSSSPLSASTTTTAPTPAALHHHNHLSHHNNNKPSSPTKNKLNGSAAVGGVVNPSSLDVENTNSTAAEDRATKRMRMSDSVDNMSNLSSATVNAAKVQPEPMESTHEVKKSLHAFK
jgi:hypothetical protein